MSSEGEQTVTLTLNLTQTGDSIKGILRAIYAAAMTEELYHTEEFGLEGVFKDGKAKLFLPHGEIVVEPVATGLKVQREIEEIWKKIP